MLSHDRLAPVKYYDLNGFYKAVLNSQPAPAVAAIANPPQKVTSKVPLSTLATKGGRGFYPPA
jgi:hypothetical protein